MIVISWIQGRKRLLGASPVYEASARVVSVSVVGEIVGNRKWPTL